MTYLTFPNYYIKLCCLQHAKGHQSSWLVRCERPGSHFTPNPSCIRHVNEAHVVKSATDDKELHIKQLRADRDDRAFFFFLISAKTTHRSAIYIMVSKMPFTLPHCTIYKHLIIFLHLTYQTDYFFTSSKILCWEVTETGRRYQQHRSSVDLPTSQSSTPTNITTTTSVATAKCQPLHQKELNHLVTTPEVPELSTGNDTSKHKITVQEPSIQENNHVWGNHMRGYMFVQEECQCKCDAKG
jgi:uncharacterized C2H2 Zn-finger protein